MSLDDPRRKMCRFRCNRNHIIRTTFTHKKRTKISSFNSWRNRQERSLLTRDQIHLIKNRVSHWRTRLKLPTFNNSLDLGIDWKPYQSRLVFQWLCTHNSLWSILSSHQTNQLTHSRNITIPNSIRIPLINGSNRKHSPKHIHQIPRWTSRLTLVAISITKQRASFHLQRTRPAKNPKPNYLIFYNQQKKMKIVS